jgi:predicted DsbA family dithiol-disulfide isomerase
MTLGVDQVPFFIVSGEFMLSGAQLPDAFLNAFEHAVVGKISRCSKNYDCKLDRSSL